jgi:hypothetical protein
VASINPALVTGPVVGFADGSAGTFDTIIFATGFERQVPFMARWCRLPLREPS